MFASIASSVVLALFGHAAHHRAPILSFTGHSPTQIHRNAVTGPVGLNPTEIKAAYHLPASGGAGKSIAIVDAYNSTTIAKDLNTFSAKFGLPQCSGASSCFQQIEVAPRTANNSSWALEEALDVEWAHAIAPQAKIVLVEAHSASGTDLLSAINYAKALPNVVAVSMSWGGSEYSGENTYDSDFTQPGVSFFAAAGDDGTGAGWPAVSPNVIGVGGTTLNLNSAGVFQSETAWSGSGGGVSTYEPEPSFQSPLVTTSGGKRATPDVAYDANPSTGVAVYDSTPISYFESGWFQVGGTSAGTPQWAAIDALGASVTGAKLYSDAASPSLYAKDFRDILSGTNGSCGTKCTASPGYDYVTGLGTPLTTSF